MYCLFAFEHLRFLDFPIPIDIYYSAEEPIRYFIRPSTTVSEFRETVCSTLDSDNITTEQSSFVFINEKGVELDPSHEILPLLEKGVPCIRYKDLSVSYFLDRTGMIMPYYIAKGNYVNSYRKEVPLHNHTACSEVHTAMAEHLQARFPRKSTYSTDEVLEAMKYALGSLKSSSNSKISTEAEKLDRTNSYLLSKLNEASEKELIIEKKSLTPIRAIFGLTVVQGAVLFYITYYMYGWDVGEPISYLIALGLETAGMYFFLKKMGDLTPKLFYGRKQEELRKKLLNKTSTSSQNDIEYSKTALSRLRAYVKTLTSL